MSSEYSRKIAMVTSLLPETNYSWYLCRALEKKLSEDLLVYTDKNPKNKTVRDCGQVESVWDKGWRFLWQLIRQAKKDRPALVHLQHEVNMFGGLSTAVLFPWAIACLKLRKIRTVVTLHAVVPIRSINKQFVRSFRGESMIAPWMLKAFFHYLNRSVGLFADRIIVHTKLLADSLEKDYGVPARKIDIIPHGVPVIAESGRSEQAGKYFLYFGYIVRRKGLENVIRGFARFLEEHQEYAEYKLVLAGGTIKGQEFVRKEVVDLVESLDISQNVELTGFIDNARIKELFEQAYVVVVPAAISISASGPLAQAFAYGKCILCSRKGNFVEEINDGKDGILVDNSEWNKAFLRVLQDKELVHLMEQGARKRALERDWDVTSERHNRLYQSVLCENNERSKNDYPS